MPSTVRDRSPESRPRHQLCEAETHGGRGCICPTRRQRENDAKGIGPIPAKDPSIEAEFKAMPAPTFQATLGDEWMDGPLPCRSNPDVFHGPGLKGPEGADLRAARYLCGGCVHRGPCLERALEQLDQFAYVGGTTPDERRAINAQRRGLATRPAPRPRYGPDTRGAVLRLTADGRTVPEIAEALQVAPRTVQRVLAENRGNTEAAA